MKTAPAPRLPGRDRRGVALVMTLAFVVLLTVLVVAYFSYCALQRQISQASLNQSAVALFAEGAVNTLTGDLRMEIMAGSDLMKDEAGNDVPGLYFPKSPLTAIPDDQGFSRAYDPDRLENDGLNNLLKRSVRNVPFYEGSNYDITTYPAPNRAAGVATSAPSPGGRYFSAARWNSALLLPKKDPASARDLTPVTTFTVPDWVLVARDGTNPKSWNDNLRWSTDSASSVVGRYAYAIYDEGGLLDVNAAGIPPLMPPDLRSGKGSLAFADLTAIPGITDDTVKALVGWRNFASAQAGGSFPAYSFDVATQQDFAEFLRENTWGYKRTANVSLNSGRSDRMFLSRRQLIQFMTQGLAQTDAQKATMQNTLQYLSTFSRDLEQPSFRPDPNRPKNTLSPIKDDPIGNGNDTFDASGVTQDQVNPALLTVRDTNGQPIMKRRFPLSRLDLLKNQGDPAYEERIKKFFGLTWKNSDHLWEYDHGDPDRIYRLSEVPPDREPDFFEVLKAVIHCDSLGKQHGGLDVSPSPHASNGSWIDGQVHLQLVQIAVNLIDQYDEDSNPTCVKLNGRELYGVENLPYLAGWQQMWYRMRPLAFGTLNPDGSVTGGDINPRDYFPADNNLDPPINSGTVYETTVMIQPIIWNPHAPDARPSPPSVPTSFRIVASGMTNVAVTTPFRAQVAKAWWVNSANLQSTFPVTDGYKAANGMTAASGGLSAFPSAVIDPAVSILTFETGAGDAAFREPFRLRAPNYPTGSNASNATGYTAGRITVGADPNLVAADGGSNVVIGFNCGKAWTGPSMDTNNTQKWLSVGSLNRDLRFRLQYRDAGGNWLTYDVIESVYNTSGNISTVDNRDISPHLRAFRTCFRADPRSDRWGLFHMAVWPTTNSAEVPNGLAALPPNGVDAGFGNNNALHYLLPQGITIKPSANSTYLLDGIPNGAAAPGWLNTPRNYNVPDLSANLPRTPNENPNSGTKPTGAQPNSPGEKHYYTDPDGVFRRASAWNFSGDDGVPLYTGNFASRPVILNRPFKSVAEMGYAFRGMAWRELDFFTPESGDAALLDAFTLNELETAPDELTVAGRVNLNTRQPKVLEAIIRGVAKDDGDLVDDQDARRAAEALVKWTNADPGDAANQTLGVFHKGPLRNRSELVGRYVVNAPFTPAIGGLTGGQTPILDGSKTYRGFSTELTTKDVFAADKDSSIKRRAESVMRALVDAGNARTWNLLIDLVAQVGRYPKSAGSLEKFVVEGETHWWVHLAIDRNTGKVVARQVEQVTE